MELNPTSHRPSVTTFPADGGLDASGAAYSANLLEDQAGSSSVIVNGRKFNIGAPNAPDAVFGSGQEIPLIEGHYTQLHLLGTGVQGAQTSQSVIVTYTDGTTSQFTQSFSDWFSPGNYPGETKAARMAYRDYSDGTQNSGPFNLYEYTFSLDSRKAVKEVQLPQNRFVLALAITLTRDSNAGLFQQEAGAEWVRQHAAGVGPAGSTLRIRASQVLKHCPCPPGRPRR
jgi:hypothetical protein